MIRALARKEFVVLRRDGRALTIVALVAGLAIAATLSGWDAVSSLERERAAAEQMDREIWNSQGDKNPHTAAHFARYAFKPTYNLAVFDPGLTSYMGNAIWLEAHYRDPAALRPIEEAVELQRIAEPSPAWLIQVFGPMLIVVLLFGAFAWERESGTLRQLKSLGVPPSALLWGKAIPVLSIVAALIVVVVSAVAIVTGAAGESIVSLPDTTGRAIVLVLAYTAYVGTFTMLSLAASALSRRSRSALAVLMGFWVISVIVVPRLSASIGSALSPAPSIPDFAARLSEESSEPFWGGSDEAVALRQSVEDGVLAEYGVETVGELPINFDGYLLQESEEYANVVFDRLYDELWGGYDRQRDIARTLSVLSPTIALQNVSMAVSGSDLFAHRHYADAAESFRRDFVLLLNQEMIDHGGADGYAYMSGNDFWAQTPDFEYSAPELDAALDEVWPDIAVLLAWLMAGAALAGLAVRRGFIREGTA